MFPGPSQKQSRCMNSSRSAQDIIQFAMPIFFGHEVDASISLDIIRIGATLGPCSVTLSTQEASARDGIKFVGTKEQVYFQSGELMKTVEITLLNDSFFDTTLEFEAVLDNADGCVLGDQLRRCRVLVDDDDVFPDNSLKEVIDQGDVAMCTQVSSFLFAYVKLAFCRVPTIWWKSMCTLAIDQLHNLCYLFRLWLRMYLIDVVLTLDADNDDLLLVPGNRHFTAVVLAMAYALPSFLLIATDRLKEGPLEISKAINEHFKVNVFRKYMNCTEDAKDQVPIQDIVAAMDVDIPSLVDGCYMSVFEISRDIGKICAGGLFLLMKLGSVALLPLLFFPVATFFFLRARKVAHVRFQNQVIEAEEDVTGFLVNSANGFQLIRDYRQRSAASMMYQERLEKCFCVMTQLGVFNFWNDRFLPTITVVGVALFLTLGTQLVLFKQVSLGLFLASVDMYQDLGDRYQGIQKMLERFVQSGSDLLAITKILNLPTDFVGRQRNSERRRHFMTECLDSFQGADDLKGFPNVFDSIPIKLVDLRVDFVPALSGISASVQAGKLVYVFGQQGSGKRSLLRCIADRMMPDGGHTVYSPHNRVLQVSSDHVLLRHMNLYENLTFGSPRVEPERILEIFSRIGLAKNSKLFSILQQEVETPLGNIASRQTSKAREETFAGRSMSRILEGEVQALLRCASAEFQVRGDDSKPRQAPTEKGKWHLHVSSMEALKIHLARAFACNPQILVTHKTLDGADAGEEHDLLLGLLREFVDCRGIAYMAGSEARRRPRTCFFSGGDHHARSNKNKSFSDVVWGLSEGHFVEELGGRGMPPPPASQLPIWEGGKVVVSTWEPAERDVIVRDLMHDDAPFHRKLRLGRYVRGRRQNDWLALSGEKGFVRIVTVTEEGNEEHLKRVFDEHAAIDIEYIDSGVQCSLDSDRLREPDAEPDAAHETPRVPGTEQRPQILRPTGRRSWMPGAVVVQAIEAGWSDPTVAVQPRSVSLPCPSSGPADVGARIGRIESEPTAGDRECCFPVGSAYLRAA